MFEQALTTVSAADEMRNQVHGRRRHAVGAFDRYQHPNH